MSPRLFADRSPRCLIPGALGLLALLLALAACGSDPTSAPAPPSTTAPSTGGQAMAPATAPAMQTPDYANLRGDIAIDGSSTVFPVTEAMAEEFGKLTDGKVRITVGVSGTGGGFKKFCAGETVITNASRPISQGEIDLCAASGIDFIELPVALDGLSVMVNPANDFVECMTIAELHTMWAPEAEEQITRWSQVRAGWPEAEFGLYAPGVDSGTFDYFTETVNGESQASRGDFLASEDDNVLVIGISGDRNGLGYFGYAYYEENAGRLKLVAVDGGDGCVAPTAETINDGSYAPLSRPLFIYVRAEAVNEPHIAAFIEYYLGAASRELVSETGYIPLPGRVYELGAAKFRNGATGAAFGGENPLHGSVEEVLAASQ